jgi:acyl-coenzyme A thioesterase PaaI-like protein
VTFDTRLLRAGTRSIVVSVEAEAGGLPAVSSTIEFTRISTDASELATRQPGEPGEWIRLGGGPLLDRPIDEACGLRVVDAATGVVELGRSPFVANSIGTLQGGAVALLTDAAAVARVGSGSRTVDLHVRFLTRTGAGPARTAAELIRSDPSGALVGVEVTDVSTDSLVAWASCRVDEPLPARVHR